MPIPFLGALLGALELKLLGSPSAVLPDQAAKIGTKDLGLLAYLALAPGPHRREELATLLWGESAEPQARASLRQCIHRLRGCVGADLRATRETVELVAPVECDVVAFERLARSAPGEAIEFDIPRFMAGFMVRHAPAFEDWIGATRRRLVGKYHELLAGQARDAMKHWRWREAASLADRFLESDPLSDDACRLAVEAWYLAGDRCEALARYARHRSAVEKELGTEPSAALAELKSRVEAEGKSAPRPISDEWLVRTPNLVGTLRGREHQWETLHTAWEAVVRGEAHVILIEGEAGAGKTRLAEEFLRWVRAEGGTVLRGEGYDSAAGIPYGPLAEALAGALEAPGLAGTDPQWLTEVTRLLPDLRNAFSSLPDPPPPAGAADRWRLFEGVAQVGFALAAERPLVMFIDDVQRCDAETCALLHFLSRRWIAVPTAVVTAWTLGDLERGAASARLYRALKASAKATVINVPALTASELRELVRELGHFEAPDAGKRLAQRLYEVTKGNPFYLTELIKTLFAQETLAVDPETGEWILGPQATADVTQRLPLPRSLHDTIGARTERLSGQLQQLLTTVAVAGTACTTELLSHVNGISRLHAAALGDELVDRHLLVEENGMYRCAHPLIVDVVRAELSTTRRREVHRAIALALESVTPESERPDQAGRIARHADRGGEPKLAFAYAIHASKAAVSRYAFEEAMSWLDLAAGASQTESEVDEANRLTGELLEAAGWAHPPQLRSIRDSLVRGLRPSDLDV